MDEAYLAAVAAGPPLPLPEWDTGGRGRPGPPSGRAVGAMAAGALLGAVVTARLLRRRPG